MSSPRPRRGLFWRVYPTLLVSLLIFAIAAAVAGRLMMTGRIAMATTMPPRAAGHAHFVILFLLLAGVVGAAAYPVLSGITRRLERLRQGVVAWGGGEMSWRADARGGDEIAALAAGFNTAADRIEALLAAHKSLLANASHELRSPLARLTLAAEMLGAGGGAALADAVRREVAEIDGLVEEILLASRLDSAADFGPVESVDCLALAAEEAARAGAELAEPTVTADRLRVSGWPRLLRRMIRNLLDNARAHGAPPVVVSVGTAEIGGRAAVRIVVRDHGPGVPAEARERIFEPFYRPAGWGEAAGGWGLGLALVGQIARRHGGEARLDLDTAGACFVVDLPADGSS